MDITVGDDYVLTYLLSGVEMIMKAVLTLLMLTIGVIGSVGACRQTSGQFLPSEEFDEPAVDLPIPADAPAITDSVDIDILPHMIHRGVVKYPNSARKWGWEGTVTVAVLVDKDGLPRGVWVPVSSGRRDLDKAAITAARKCRFRPAYSDGKPAYCWITFKYEFTLRK
jgi:TonB family protein